MVSCCAVHNFIRKDSGDIDPLFKEALEDMYGQNWVDLSRRDHMPAAHVVSPGHRPDQSAESKEIMEIYRDSICNSMWHTMNM